MAGLNRPRPRKGSHVISAPDRPASGGEPLWRVSDQPVIFVPAPIPPLNVATGGSHELQSAGSSQAVTTFHLFEDEDDDEDEYDYDKPWRPS